MKRVVTVMYKFDDLILEQENERGVLVGNQVFVCGKDRMPGLYNASPTEQKDVYLVDLDSDGRDYFESEIFTELITA
ncbi:hypothetical protein [Niallia sp. Krafla_26]|uniref:hypothetical protein n=1 Tax=Niallia sp. Krafla_26 TaxID=3064703 RepID=UPI003D174B47